MSRTTKKIDFIKIDDFRNTTYLTLQDLINAYNKLIKLENLDEQLGCPLEVVFKALKDGIFIENIYGEIINFKCRLAYKNEELGWYFNIINGYVMVKDYKKTWWLRKDKSE